ncbi:MAG TPA: PDZ domain-containing protein [Smithella sp.]|nr:PDZ domain-containing protein [Smithella sp.]
MWLKITQTINEHWKQISNISAMEAMNVNALKSFLIILAITILSYEATDLFYKIVSFPLMNHAVAVKSAGASSAVKDNRQRGALQDYDIISGRNLFLSTLKPAGGNQSDGGIFDSDQKTTDFDLKGTVAFNSSFGFIVVEERASHKQKLYRLGDKIGPDKLVKITRNTATLRNGGRDIILKIKETLEGSLLSNPPGTGRDGASSSNLTLSRKTVNDNFTNLNSLMNQAVLRPFLNKGVQEGYIISNIAPNSLYEKAGLRNGDVIIDINNNKMQNVNEISQIMNSMQSGSSMDLNVRKNGKTETIHYSFE